jgi:magnesium-transporting ATPase (P-type)
MTQARLRISIFTLWVGFWVISTISLALAPWLRLDKAINHGQIIPALLSISGIWIPPLTCLASFWFPLEEQRKARNIVISKDRVYAALVLTITYLIFVLMLIVWVLYFVDYYPQADELPAGASFQERLGDSVIIALLVSPLALAPIGWITGGHVARPPRRD